MGAARSVFDASLGTGQGRVVPANATPFDGSYVFVLGSDAPGVFASLVVGDFFEIEQFGDITNVAFVRARAHLRAPVLTGDLTWRLSLRLDGVEVYSTTLYRGLDRIDLAIPTGALTGDHWVGFRLELFGTAGTYSVELPGVYLDALVADPVLAREEIVNRDPGRDESGVPVDRSISFDLINAEGDTAISIPETQVYVNNVLAYDGGAGGFQTGFAGSVDPTIAGGFGLRVVVDPDISFAPSASVEVRVLSHFLEATWSFSTEDTIGPTLIQVSAIGRTVLRVIFSEPVKQIDADVINDALNLYNYAITIAATSLAEGLPAVPLEIVSVAAETDATVLLTLDTEMTGGALYLLTVTNVEDVSDNEIIAPNSALFTGYACPVPAGRRFDLIDFIPDMNVDEDETEDLHKFVACLQEVNTVLLCDIDHWTDILDVDMAAERFVDAMLRGLGNPFAFDLSEIDKRRLARVLVSIYKQKGLARGIINAIRFFTGVEVTISYPAFADDIWILGVSELGFDTALGTSSSEGRYSYTIVSSVNLTDEQISRITKLAKYMQPAHEHLTEITVPPPAPPVPDDWELSLSELGIGTILH